MGYLPIFIVHCSGHPSRAQEVFKLMGLMDENPEELEIELVGNYEKFER